jgi:hypothetical protein
MRFGLASLLLVLALAPAARADFTLGYNQGWLEGNFGRDLSAGWDEAAWRKLLARTRESGGSVLRVWLFEGQPMEGVQFDAGDPHRPIGVEPDFLEHVRRLGALASEEGVQLYWTGFDGNFFGATSGLEFDRRWNIFNDKYGFGTAFQEKVLGPVLDAIREHADSVYAFDVLNEIEGSLHVNAFAEGWDGARAFMESWARFVHARAPGLRTTVSAGWGSSVKDILAGRFDGVGLDYLDVHLYSDAPKIEKGEALAAHARAQGVPIVIGELGQKSEKVDPALQARIVKGVVTEAQRLGFTGVFVWRLVDEQPHDKRLSFYDGETPRPAVEVMKTLAAALVPARRGLVQAFGD